MAVLLSLRLTLDEAYATTPIYGLAVIYDLADFTLFFNQPDAQPFIGQYLNRITGEISTIIAGGKPSWEGQEALDPLKLSLLQRKFLGDGELLIFELPKNRDEASQATHELFYRMTMMGLGFRTFTSALEAELPLTNLPKRVRFGAASGVLFELPLLGKGPSEYVGSSINLASRLSKYSRDLTLIYSASLRINLGDLTKNTLRQYVAKSVRGFPDQKVICLVNQVEGLEETERKRLFRD